MLILFLENLCLNFENFIFKFSWETSKKIDKNTTYLSRT